MKGNEIRRSFLEFFAARGHTVVPSSPLIPADDPTLLFTNAGMVQFKDIFLGRDTRPYRRAVDAQKCLRISGKHNDLEQVGRDTYHHTFFEMLGNWSFGDYYKEEAIAWAWELLVREWGLSAERLWATVHVSDDEAAAAWLRVTPLPASRLLRFDAENFWEMGDTGPCGPCSEIHLDRGPQACDRRGEPGHKCAVNSGCARFLELWNLVFIQHDRQPDGSLADLPARHVDTGMGLERIAAVLQGVPGNYDCDLLRDIIATAEKLSGRRYGADPAQDVSLRVIADHSRAVTFMIADGVQPGNEGRGYVLRRLLRRAARHGKLLGLDGPFLYRVSGAVVDSLGEAYPELVAGRTVVAETIRAEEERFAETLDRGLALLAQEVARARARGSRWLPGEAAFRLYDTYGFPLDLTEDILAAEGMAVDRAEFDRCMEEQRARARGARRIEGATVSELSRVEIAPGVPLASRFVGDRVEEWESEVLAILVGGRTVASAREGHEVEVLTAETPFYGEAGGQVGDRGVLETDAGALVEVVDTKRPGPSLIVHCGRVVRGGLSVGERVRLKIDVERRERTRLNHSATHLLHGVLRERLGTHVRQAGSAVMPERLRFDFTHPQAVGEEELARIEEEVNARVRANVEVTFQEMPLKEALARGALAFFGEKYGERVRVVRMGDFSTELCGGTHVARTGDIGLFKLRGESSVAAGVRRIEALSGPGALDFVRRREAVLREVGGLLRGSEEEAAERVARLLAEQRELERRVARLQSRLAAGGGGGADPLAAARRINGVQVLATRVEGLDERGLREVADRLRERLGSGLALVGTVKGDRALLVAAVTTDLSNRYHAGKLIGAVAPLIGGRGGGRADFAQAGGRNPAGLDAALARFYEVVEKAG